MTQDRPEPATIYAYSSTIGQEDREDMMNAVLSALFGGGLVVLIYGFSFIPSATLLQDDDDDTIIELSAKKDIDS